MTRQLFVVLLALTSLIGCQDDELIRSNQDLRKQVRVLEQTSSLRGKDIDELNKEVDSCKAKNGALSKENTRLQGEVDRLKRDLSQKDDAGQDPPAQPEPPVHCEVPTDPNQVIVKVPDYTGRYRDAEEDGTFPWTIPASPAKLPPVYLYSLNPWEKQPPLNSPCTWVKRERYPGGPTHCAPECLYNEEGVSSPTDEVRDRCFPKIPVSWRYLLDQRLTEVVDMAKEYTDEDDYSKVSMLHYGLLALGDSSILGGMSIVYDRDFVGKLLPQIYKRGPLREAMFTWVMPSFKTVFGQLSLRQRKAYMMILDDAIAYTRQMDVSVEDAYLERLRNDQEEWVFTREDPSGKSQLYRKGHAFIYRRVKQGVPKNVILSFLQRARAQLAPLAK